MNETEIIEYITGTFEGVDRFTGDDNHFFFYDPEKMFPFATLMTNDLNDKFSNLDRPSIYRLNIGVGKETFKSLFGDTHIARWDEEWPADTPYDFTALDVLMPHPVYGRQYWLSILNPSAETFEVAVKPLLAEAYERDVAKHTRRGTRN